MPPVFTNVSSPRRSAGGGVEVDARPAVRSSLPLIWQWGGREAGRRFGNMARQLKKRPIEKELKFLADFEIYGVLLFVGLYFATK